VALLPRWLMLTMKETGDQDEDKPEVLVMEHLHVSNYDFSRVWIIAKASINS
jgi:hypothetical protein